MEQEIKEQKDYTIEIIKPIEEGENKENEAETLKKENEEKEKSNKELEGD